MTHTRHLLSVQWLVFTLALVLCGPGGAHRHPAMASDIGEVEIRGDLPRNDDGSIDVSNLQDTVADEFSRGNQEVQFRNFSLTAEESRELFLNSDPDRNLLRQLGETLPNDGIERNVKFRGVIDGQRVEGRVQRDEDGSLRVRTKNLSFGDLSAEDRARLAEDLSAQTGFDRVRLEGIDAEGNRVRTEFRSDKGLVKNEVKGGGGGGNRRGDRRDRVGDDPRDNRHEDQRADRRENRREDHPF